MSNSLQYERHGDKENSSFFEDYLVRLLEERDRVGLTDMIFEIDALMLTVDPGHSIDYISELCLMTPYHYLVTLEGIDTIARRRYRRLRRIVGNVVRYNERLLEVFRQAALPRPDGKGAKAVVLVGDSDLESVVEWRAEKAGLHFSRPTDVDALLPGTSVDATVIAGEAVPRIDRGRTGRGTCIWRSWWRIHELDDLKQHQTAGACGAKLRQSRFLAGNKVSDHYNSHRRSLRRKADSPRVPDFPAATGDIGSAEPRPLTPTNVDYYADEAHATIALTCPALAGTGTNVFRDDESMMGVSP